MKALPSRIGRMIGAAILVVGVVSVFVIKRNKVEPEGEHNGMEDSEHVELESQATRRSDLRHGSPAKVDRTELETGPSSSTDTRWPMQHRDPAQTRPQEFDLTPNKKPRFPKPSSPTVSYKSDETPDNEMKIAISSRP